MLLYAVRLLLLLPFLACALQCRKGPCNSANSEYRELIRHRYEQLQVPKPNSKPDAFSSLTFNMFSDFDQIFERHMVARR
jgi:hypothetical protein